MTETTASARSASVGDRLALTVHGPAGVVDLLVPDGATVADLAREYAQQAASDLGARPGAGVLGFRDRMGRPLAEGVALGDLGLRSGAVVVAAGVDAGAGHAAASDVRPRRDATTRAGALSALVVAVGVLAGLFAALGAVLAGRDAERDLMLGLLAAGAVVCVLPVGALARQRVVAAPAWGAGFGLVAVWDPAPERLPMVLGVAALAAAVTAAVGRSLVDEDAVLRVWMVAGLALFAVAGVAAVAGLPERVVWASWLMLSMFAGRFVPSSSINVPDQALIDVERLAVTAWSARERTSRRRSRMVIRRPAVAGLVERGTRIVTAASAAVLVVSVVAAPLLLASTTLPLDRVGAPVLVALIGCTQLLVARSYRYPAARLLLRLAGLWCLAWVVGAVLVPQGWAAPLALVAVAAGAAAATVAVAVGRGWRSVWWSRRADVLESMTGAFAVPAFVVTVGLFRWIWEIVG